jgi:hypothetical protein
LRHPRRVVRATRDVRAGENWSKVDFERLWACSNRPNYTCSAKARVVGREQAAVKAGTFDAWKIEVELRYSSRAGSMGASGVVTFTYWYVEVQRRYVKYQSRSLGASGGGETLRTRARMALA